MLLLGFKHFEKCKYKHLRIQAKAADIYREPSQHYQPLVSLFSKTLFYSIMPYVVMVTFFLRHVVI